LRTALSLCTTSDSREVLTKTVDVRLADAASELTLFLRVKSVVVASAATIDKLETAISRSVVIPRRTVVITVASRRS